MAKKLNYLFVCLANENRSPTAEAVCRRIVEENNLDIEVSSAGISKGANNPLTKGMADAADRIFVMEREMIVTLRNEFGQNPGKIVCLSIPDRYPRDDPWLIKILEDKLYEHFEEEGLLVK